MSVVLPLVRDDLRGFAGYASARREATAGRVWLNANEAAAPSVADERDAVRRYPEPQPARLRDRLAALYGVPPESLLLCRGSDEAIDLLVRTLCTAGRDPIVIQSPVFGMYAVAARVQGVPVVDVPLRDDGDRWVADPDAVGDAALRTGARLVFLCSPANPTGGALPATSVLGLARRLEGRAVVVVDEAYVEYGTEPSLAPAVAMHPNLAVLRTLSKAHALAGARVGAAIADPALAAVLRDVQAPYPLPEPSIALALAATEPDALAATKSRIAATRSERARLAAAFAARADVRAVYPSDANFLLVRFRDVAAVRSDLDRAGIVVRSMTAYPGLGDALRITIGARADVDALLAAIDAPGRDA